VFQKFQRHGELRANWSYWNVWNNWNWLLLTFRRGKIDVDIFLPLNLRETFA
jgi:hypothetical protein